MIYAGVVNGVMYNLSTVCQWAALPKDLPPAQHGERVYLRRWDDDRTLDRIHHALYVQCRELPDERPARQQRRLTARASPALKRGLHRSAWL